MTLSELQTHISNLTHWSMQARIHHSPYCAWCTINSRKLWSQHDCIRTAGLAGKEHSNPQFMFLKPTHSMFGFFTSLCDSYSRVLMPDKGLMQKLQKDADDRSVFMRNPPMYWHQFLLYKLRKPVCCCLSNDQSESQRSLLHDTCSEKSLAS